MIAPGSGHPDAATVEQQTRLWFERLVIGLNLCPFAHAPWRSGRIRWCVSAARDTQRLLADLRDELQRLADTPADQIETTVLVHPLVLGEFDAYNQFFNEVTRTVSALSLDGVIQVAGFHPDYCFADAPVDDQANATNRSPWPMLHLLREDSITAVIDAGANIEAIIERNLATLRALPPAQFATLMQWHD